MQSGDPERAPGIRADFAVNVEPTLPGQRSSAANNNRYYMYQSRSRLNNEQIDDVLQAIADGRSLRSVAKEFGVSHETVRVIVLCRTNGS